MYFLHCVYSRMEHIHISFAFKAKPFDSLLTLLSTQKNLSESHRTENCCLAVFCGGMLMTVAPVTPPHMVFISLYTQEQNSDGCLDIPLISTFSNRLGWRDIIQSESYLRPVRCGQRICTNMSYTYEFWLRCENNRNEGGGSVPAAVFSFHQQVEAFHNNRDV